MCHETKEVRYIDLYTVGSEGTDLCHECEMEVVGFIRRRTHILLSQAVANRRPEFARELGLFEIMMGGSIDDMRQEIWMMQDSFRAALAYLKGQPMGFGVGELKRRIEEILERMKR